MMEMLFITLSNTVATHHMWLLSSGNETSEDENLTLTNLHVNGYMWLVAILLDSTQEKMSTLIYSLVHKTHRNLKNKTIDKIFKHFCGIKAERLHIFLTRVRDKRLVSFVYEVYTSTKKKMNTI